ncbi:hypothetical protein Q8F55_008155 [Vanrija albida]|uniref:RanBP2-type domain-containing protein n=1 Tax=Vanrija albida TaxID=181172 RepID=A0ABR3PVU3_9TREE
MLDRRDDSSYSSDSESDLDSLSTESAMPTRACQVPDYVATHPVFKATGALDWEPAITFPCTADTFFKVMTAATKIYEVTKPNEDKLAVAAFLTRLSHLNEWAHYEAEDERRMGPMGWVTRSARRRRGDATPTESERSSTPPSEAPSQEPSPEPMPVEQSKRFERPSSSLTAVGSEDTLHPPVAATRQHVDDLFGSLQADIVQGFARIESKIDELHAPRRSTPPRFLEEAQTLQSITRLLSKLEVQANLLADHLDASVRKAEHRNKSQLPVSREELCIRLAEMTDELNDIKLLRQAPSKVGKGVTVPEIVVTAAKSRTPSKETTPVAATKAAESGVPSTPPAWAAAPTSQFTFGTDLALARAPSITSTRKGEAENKANTIIGATIVDPVPAHHKEVLKTASNTALRPAANPFTLEGAPQAVSDENNGVRTTAPRLPVGQNPPRLTFTFGSVTPLGSEPLAVPSVADGAGFSKYAGKPTVLFTSKGETTLSTIGTKAEGQTAEATGHEKRNKDLSDLGAPITSPVLSVKNDPPKATDDIVRLHGRHPYAPAPNLPSRHPSQVRRAMPASSNEKVFKGDEIKATKAEEVNETKTETKPKETEPKAPTVSTASEPATTATTSLPSILSRSRSPSPLPSIKEDEEHEGPLKSVWSVEPQSDAISTTTLSPLLPLFAQPLYVPPSRRTSNGSNSSNHRENSFSYNPAHAPGWHSLLDVPAPMPSPDLWAQTRPPVSSIAFPPFPSPFPPTHPPPRPYPRSTNPFINTPPPPPEHQPSAFSFPGQPGRISPAQPGIPGQPGRQPGIPGQPGRLTPTAPVFVPAAAGPLFRPPSPVLRPPSPGGAMLNSRDWTCKRCTLVNTPPSVAFCSLCEAPRDPGFGAPASQGFPFVSHPWRPI